MVDYSAVFVLQTSNLLFCLLVEEFCKVGMAQVRAQVRCAVLLTDGVQSTERFTQKLL